MSRFRDLRICSGTANLDHAERIAGQLGVELGDITVKRFADGETRVQYEQTVRGVDLFLVQPTCPPVNDNLMELLLMIDAAKRASAARVTAVIPYFGYSRQDRKDRPRVPISAKLVANMLEEAGADRILAMHLHADQIQGFFDVPVDHLYSTPVVIDHLRERFPPGESVIVSPDAGAVNRSRALAKRLDFELAIIDKRRPKPNMSQVANIIGDVERKNCILLDDMVDTAGTLTHSAEALDEAGAASVHAVATHPILSDPAPRRLRESELDTIIVCDTIPLNGKMEGFDNLTVLNTSKLFADAITCVHEEQSIQKLFVW